MLRFSALLRSVIQIPAAWTSRLIMTHGSARWSPEFGIRGDQRTPAKTKTASFFESRFVQSKRAGMSCNRY